MGVLITNADDWICLNICRSLGARGITVGLASHDRSAMSFKSKYCKHIHLYTNPLLSEGDFIKDLIEVVKNNNYEFLIPTNDVTLMAISSNRKSIGKYVGLPIPPHEILELCDDKSRTMRLAQKLGIPHPKTFFVEDISDIDNFRGDFEFPVVIKPFRGQGAEGVCFVPSPNSLRNMCTEALRQHGNVMIQEYLKGERYVMPVIFNYVGEARVLSLHRAIRFVGGATILGETIYQKEVMELGLRLLREIGFFGMGMIDFIIDERDGKPKLMEINPRFFASVSIHMAAGVDYPYLFYRMVKDGDIEEFLNCRRGVRSRHLLFDIKHLGMALFGKVPYNYSLTKKQTLINFIKSFNCRSDYIFSIHDPLPGVMELKNIAYRKLGV